MVAYWRIKTMEMPKLSSKKVVTVAQERCLFMRGSNCNDLIVNVFSVFGWWLLYYYILLYYILATYKRCLQHIVVLL